MPWTLEPTETPAQKDVAALDRGLLQFNRDQLGAELAEYVRHMAVFARDEHGELKGGVHGWYLWEWLHVETLWVAEQYRGHGLGTALMQEIEALAEDHMATGIHLETTDFQALPFYRQLGYTLFGELPGKPAGHTWYYLQKRLR